MGTLRLDRSVEGRRGVVSACFFRSGEDHSRSHFFCLVLYAILIYPVLLFANYKGVASTSASAAKGRPVDVDDVGLGATMRVAVCSSRSGTLLSSYLTLYSGCRLIFDQAGRGDRLCGLGRHGSASSGSSGASQRAAPCPIDNATSA